MTEAKRYSTSVDEYDPQQGYAISASVINDNDVSCDIAPYFAVDVVGIANSTQDLWLTAEVQFG